VNRDGVTVPLPSARESNMDNRQLNWSVQCWAKSKLTGEIFFAVHGSENSIKEMIRYLRRVYSSTILKLEVWDHRQQVEVYESVAWGRDRKEYFRRARAKRTKNLDKIMKLDKPATTVL
jgi:hypothetical protein